MLGIVCTNMDCMYTCHVCASLELTHQHAFVAYLAKSRNVVGTTAVMLVAGRSTDALSLESSDQFGD